MSRGIEEDQPVGAPEWIVTFSDMVSLLVTFFILLMTFSSMDLYDAFQAPGDLSGTRGILAQAYGSSTAEPPREDLMAAMDAARGSDTPHSRPPDGLPASIAEMGQKLTDEQIEIDLVDVSDGLLIQFDPSAAFAPGSATVGPELARSLAEFGRTLEHYPHLVVVEGHTDAGFEPEPRYPTAQDLGLARAQAAAAELLARSRLAPTLVQVAGIGAGRPIASNDTASGRAANRRVEVRVLSLSRTRYADLTGGR